MEQFGYVMAFNTFWAVPSGRIQTENEWSLWLEACYSLCSVFKEFAQAAVFNFSKVKVIIKQACSWEYSAMIYLKWNYPLCGDHTKEICILKSVGTDWALVLLLHNLVNQCSRKFKWSSVVVDLYLNMEKTMESRNNTHEGNEIVVLVRRLGFF